MSLNGLSAKQHLSFKHNGRSAWRRSTDAMQPPVVNLKQVVFVSSKRKNRHEQSKVNFDMNENESIERKAVLIVHRECKACSNIQAEAYDAHTIAQLMHCRRLLC